MLFLPLGLGAQVKNARNRTLDPKDIYQIVVTKVDFAVSTFTHVSCDQFEREFGDTRDIIHLRADRDIPKVLQWLTQAKKEGLGCGDTRAKVYIEYNNANRADTLCFGVGNEFSWNGTSYTLPTDSLIRYLDEIGQ